MSFTNYAYADDAEAQTGVITRYDRNSADKVNKLRERMYVTVSDAILDCVYKTSTPKSDYRDELTDLVVFEEWGGTTYSPSNNFPRRQIQMSRLAEYFGIRNVYYIDHVWQRDSYDISLPAHFPAGSMYGTEAELKELVNVLRGKYGWKYALHEDYWFMHPTETNQYWNDPNVGDYLAKDANGDYRIGWVAAHMSSYAIKVGEMKHYSSIESPQIKAAYNTNGVFLDVSATGSPAALNQITLDAESDTSRSLAQATEEMIDFFQFIKRIHSSALSSEGSGHVESYGSIYAGFVESVEREINDGINARIMPDYEIKFIRPLMVGQGMGYHVRYANYAVQDATFFDFDRYNTMAVAYGHSGLMNNMMNGVTDEHYVNTYYMFQAIQSQYLDTSVTVDDIRYYDGADALTLEQAVLSGYDFRIPRLYIMYSNGLEIYLNFSDENWVVTMGGKSYTLDKNGYAAHNPQEDFLQYSCLINGNRVDFVDSTNYTYANARGKTTDFGSFTTDKMIILRKDNPDTRALTLSDLSAEKVTFRGVTIGLRTSKPARVTLYIGENSPTTEYTFDTPYATSHTLNLKSGLRAGTSYTYKVVVEDLAGNRTESSIRRFRTTGNPGDELPKVLIPRLNTPIIFSNLFSDINGNNSFHYLEHSFGDYVPMEYNDASSYWEGSEAYLGIGQNNLHSGFSKDAALGFQCPRAGVIRVDYTVRRMNDEAPADGTNFSIRHGDRILLPDDGREFVTLVGDTILKNTMTVDVRAGDFLYFKTNKSGELFYDQLLIELTLTYTSFR